MKEELRKALELAAIAYQQDKEVTDDLVNAYCYILKEFSIDEIKKAFFRHLQTSKFFPRPADIAIIIKPSLLHQMNEFGY